MTAAAVDCSRRLSPPSTALDAVDCQFAGWQGGGSYRPWSSLNGGNGIVDDNNDGDDDRNGDDGNCREDDGIVHPDILCLGKVLPGGYVTLDETLPTSEVARGILSGGGVFMHGPTFMANPLACSVLLVSVNLLMSSPWEGGAGSGGGGGIERALVSPGRVEVGGTGG